MLRKKRVDKKRPQTDKRDESSITNSDNGLTTDDVIEQVNSVTSGLDEATSELWKFLEELKSDNARPGEK